MPVRLPNPRVRRSTRLLAILGALAMALVSSCSSPTGPTPPPVTAPTPPMPPPATVAPLTISCPANVTLTAATSPANVTFAAPTTTGGVPPAQVTCTRQSGSPFTAGASTVLCTAIDAASTSVSCQFSVTVNVTAPRLSRTRFLAFGDSVTAGEITSPTGVTASGAPNYTLIVVPTASYPAVLQGRLHSTYTTQASSIVVANAGEPNERILDGAERFPGAYDATRPEVVLLMEGVNGLPGVGPDISTGVMRIMVQHAKAGGSRVFVGSMIPQVPGRPRGNTPTSELLAYNATLRLMSQQEGMVFVDLYTAMLADAATLIGSDGLHPTEAGYRRIAELFFASIRADLEMP